MANPFEQLVTDLKTGKLTFLQVSIAVRAWVRERKDLPVEIRGLLGGTSEGDHGLLGNQFATMRQTIGAMELAARRAMKDGEK